MSQVPTFWHLDAIGHQPPGTTTDTTLPGQGVTIALIDTGVDGTHPALTGRIIAACNITLTGLQPVPNTSDHDFHGHGTRIAGLICADHANGGVAPAARIVSLVYPQTADNFSRLYLALRALAHEVENGRLAIDVVNLSAGLDNLQPGRKLMLQHLLERLLRRGILVITSVGNQRRPGEPPLCPAELAVALAVGASGINRRVCDFSRSGRMVSPANALSSKPDLVAPGEQLVTCERGGVLGQVRGTSFATAIVTGVAARFLQRTRLSAVELREIVVLNCALLPHDPTERQGAGLVQVP